ncbi:hypothetical protein ACLOAV_010164 [Pseudogymnoascus australis]
MHRVASCRFSSAYGATTIVTPEPDSIAGTMKTRSILLEAVVYTDTFFKVGNLFSIWMLFSRCSGSIEEGRRLEGLTWRLWNRETFCCAPGEANTTATAICEEDIESENEGVSTSAPLTRPRVRSQDSGCNRCRDKERHIIPDDLEKMVNEKKGLEPLTMSAHSYLAPRTDKINLSQITTSAQPISSAPEPEKTSPPSSSAQKSPESITTGGASERSETSVVRGWPDSFQESSLENQMRQSKKNKAPSNMFRLGGSSRTRYGIAGKEVRRRLYSATHSRGQSRNGLHLGGSRHHDHRGDE